MAEHEHENAAHGHDHHGHNHGGVGKYLAVFGGLCVLTAISFYIGNSTIKETAPQVAWVSMMAVSCAKALLVMLFFMHLIWEANWKYVLTIPATVMSVFLVLMLVPDIAHRTDHYHPTRWLHSAEPDLSHADYSEEAEHNAEHSSESEAGASDDGDATGSQH